MNSSVFGSVPVRQKKFTNFNLSHEVSGTFPLSKMCPVFMTDTLPGDSFRIKAWNTTKLETLIAPAMQRIDASLMWFKLPKRLVYKHFKKWYSGGTDGQDNHQKPHIHLFQLADDIKSAMSAYIDEYSSEITSELFGPGSLWQYLGLPVPLKYNNSTGAWEVLDITQWGEYDDPSGIGDSDYVDIMPLMAYHMIHDQYFVDQTLGTFCYEDSEESILKINNDYNKFLQMPSDGTNIQLPNTTGYDLSEGGEIVSADVLRLLFCFKRAWKKEYYTSALPSPQRGPQVSLDMFNGAQVPVDSPDGFYLKNQDLPGYASANVVTGSDTNNTLEVDGNSLEFQPEAVVGSGSGLVADLSGLSPITIAAFRNLFKLQAFLEKNNVAGGRYIETILAHWGERVPDFTVQRSQFVRATSVPVQISEVTATANSSGFNSQLGDQAGRARTQGNIGGVSIYTQEPGFIFALYQVGCPPAYAGQGIPRMYQRVTRFDEPWTDFQHIGEQNIKTRELWFDFENNSGNNNEDFGYQQRFSELKYMPDRVVGDFATDMSFWHMARMFKAKPALNEQFITQNLDERIFAVQNVRPVVADFYFDVKRRSHLSKFSSPKIS